MKTLTAKKARTTNRYLVDGPGGKWSIWDFGDEMTVHEGPLLTDRVAARVRPERAARMDDGHRWQHVVDAAGAIRVAVLLGWDSPNFHLLWE